MTSLSHTGPRGLRASWAAVKRVPLPGLRAPGSTAQPTDHSETSAGLCSSE